MIPIYTGLRCERQYFQDLEDGIFDMDEPASQAHCHMNDGGYNLAGHWKVRKAPGDIAKCTKCDLPIP